MNESTRNRLVFAIENGTELGTLTSARNGPVMGESDWMANHDRDPSKTPAGLLAGVVKRGWLALLARESPSPMSELKGVGNRPTIRHPNTPTPQHPIALFPPCFLFGGGRAEPRWVIRGRLFARSVT